jgi:hemoglobin-like flavoprotein
MQILNQVQIELINRSWSQLAWNSPKLLSSFHIHLFNVDPDAQSLFVGDKGQKVTGMMSTIDVAVGLLEHWDLFTRKLRDFGKRHAGYGVVDLHYLGFGEALMLTLGEYLGADFTPDTQDAWRAFYGLMAKSMIEGSKS